ncbi:uncharacterized protein [Erythrolamprus reginae]|uniref:uncharacterized protein n=1 Tax=Erythrolamprus reginae TaxID=121349 RepID=UPI00396CE861
MFISCINIVPWARLHARPLQWFLLPFQRARLSNSKRQVHLTTTVRLSLMGWTSPALTKGSPFLAHQELTITTDTSLSGWEAHSRGQVAQGRWSPADLEDPNINRLELRAVFKALQSFSDMVEGQHVLILTDNVATRAHVNHQGGTRSDRLMQEAHKLMSWAERHLASIRAEHISGIENTQADWLSRTTIDPGEWTLNPEAFQLIVQRYGVPVADLFATQHNRQLPRFFSRFPTPEAEQVNALLSPWPKGLLYAFPPVCLLHRVVAKIISEEADILLVAPYWPRRPWFANLMGLSILPPWRIPLQRLVLTQGSIVHPDPQWWKLAVWRLKGTA